MLPNCDNSGAHKLPLWPFGIIASALLGIARVCSRTDRRTPLSDDDVWPERPPPVTAQRMWLGSHSEMTGKATRMNSRTTSATMNGSTP